MNNIVAKTYTINFVTDALNALCALHQLNSFFAGASDRPTVRCAQWHWYRWWRWWAQNTNWKRRRRWWWLWRRRKRADKTVVIFSVHFQVFSVCVCVSLCRAETRDDDYIDVHCGGHASHNTIPLNANVHKQTLCGGNIAQLNCQHHFY